MNLEGLGKAISEAIALRQMMATLDSKVGVLKVDIAQNEKEIARRKGLEAVNERFSLEVQKLTAQLGEQNAELQKRLDSLKESGVELPVGKDLPKGIVAL